MLLPFSFTKLQAAKTVASRKNFGSYFKRWTLQLILSSIVTKKRMLREVSASRYARFCRIITQITTHNLSQINRFKFSKMIIFFIYKHKNFCIILGSECESAQFRTSKPLSIDDTIGTCSLSKFERGTRPQAYRSSMYRDEYLQDQCHNICKSLICLFGYKNRIVSNLYMFLSSEEKLLFLCGVSERNIAILGCGVAGTRHKAGISRISLIGSRVNECLTRL